MKRRQFIAGLGSAAAWPVVARAQQPAVPVIGWLTRIPSERAPFARGLAATGYVLGRNVTMESRQGGIDRLPALAADLVRRHVTVIVASGTGAARAAKVATQTIPVVFGMASDPVEAGLVASLNRPSGNLTGFASMSGEIAAKRFELLHKLVPAADSIAMLAREASGPIAQVEVRAMQSAARVLGVRLLVLYAATESEVATAFATIVEQRAGALLIAPSVISPSVSDQVISLAGRYAVPTLFLARNGAVSGGLASYGAEGSELTRQSAVYTGRVLKGEKPADLPVMQATKFEFVINLKTAKALGLTIPETLLATADEVIQ